MTTWHDLCYLYSMRKEIIAWWSGGIASAVVCKWALDTFKNVRVIYIETRNEHPDTERFLFDCEFEYGVKIERVWNDRYTCIQDVWRRFNTLQTANGAVCSSELKRNMRNKIQDVKVQYAQIFGFDKSEGVRITNMRKNYPEINAIAPLYDMRITKEMCITEIRSWGIEIPIPYLEGYRNNNCQLTGCVQGGIGYWQKIQREQTEVFLQMASMEHELTEAKSKPVTCIRILKEGKMEPLFLLPHPSSPYHLGIAKGREPKPLQECNGFCKTTMEQLDFFEEL